MPFGWNGRRLRGGAGRGRRRASVDLVLAEQDDRSRRSRTAATRSATDVGVDRLRRLTLEPEHHRPVAAVPVPGRAERAEQLGPHPGDAGAAGRPSSRPSAKVRAARIGPTVCDVDGPMPIENRSNTLMAMAPTLTSNW